MTTIATGLGVLVVGLMPNGRVEGIHLATPEGSQAAITRAGQTGRYREVMAANVFQRVRCEVEE